MSERLYFTGIGASPGIAVGKAVVLEAAGPAVFRVPIRSGEVEHEVDRFRAARAETRRQLEELRASFEEEHRETAGGIFDAQLLMLEDSALCGAALSPRLGVSSSARPCRRGRSPAA